MIWGKGGLDCSKSERDLWHALVNTVIHCLVP
jgi:hypothetical protein